MVCNRWSVGLLAAALAGGVGLARPAKVSTASNDAAPPVGTATIEPGPLSLVTPSEPAKFGFDRAEGRVESAGEGAARAARSVLCPPDLPHPYLEAAVGVVGFVAAPFAAGYGAVKAGHQRLSPAELSEVGTALNQALKEMSAQSAFQQLLAEAVAEKTHRQVLVRSERTAVEAQPARAMLEARVERLYLERSGPKDSSFRLLIKARALLRRATDGAVISEQPYEYCSGKAMFIDWTRHEALAGVARTAYQEVSGHIADSLAPYLCEQPVLVGAGYHHAARKQPNHQPDLVAKAAGMGVSRIQFVRYPAESMGSLEIFAPGPKSSFFLQRPVTRSEEASEQQTDLEYQFDGLEQDRNPVIQFVACLAAVPVGLYEQTVGAIRGASSGKVEAAEARLRSAVQQAQPEQALAGGVARELALRTSSSVMAARASVPSRRADIPVRSDSRLLGGSAELRASSGWLVYCKQETPRPQSETGQSETSLEIRLVDASLSGEPGADSPLALRVEAQATLRCISDGRVIYSCPVQYRGVEKKFSAWAAHDASAFRAELKQSYQQMSDAIADRVAEAGLGPLNSARNVVARN